MRLRAAGPEDAAALAALHASAFPPGEAWSADAFARLFALHGVRGLLVEEEGLLLWRLVAGEAEILTLAVHPGARRRGVARALVETALLLLAAAGAEALLLEVAEENGPALALYAGLGFAPAGRRPDYYGPGRSAKLLRRALAG